MPFQARFAPIKANLLLQLNVIVIIFIAKKLSFKLKGTDGKEYDYVMKKGTMEIGSSTAVKE